MITALRAFVGSLARAAIAGGWSGIKTAFSKCLFGAALRGCWIPVSIYYEGHRFRWVYIFLYYLALTLLALLIAMR